jgi:hypothetical protein
MEAKKYRGIDNQSEEYELAAWCCKGCMEERKAKALRRLEELMNLNFQRKKGYSGIVGTRRKPLVFKNNNEM